MIFYAFPQLFFIFAFRIFIRKLRCAVFIGFIGSFRKKLFQKNFAESVNIAHAEYYSVLHYFFQTI